MNLNKADTLEPRCCWINRVKQVWGQSGTTLLLESQGPSGMEIVLAQPELPGGRNARWYARVTVSKRVSQVDSKRGIDQGKYESERNSHRVQPRNVQISQTSELEVSSAPPM